MEEHLRIPFTTNEELDTLIEQKATEGMVLIETQDLFEGRFAIFVPFEPYVEVDIHLSGHDGLDPPGITHSDTLSISGTLSIVTATGKQSLNVSGRWRITVRTIDGEIAYVKRAEIVNGAFNITIAGAKLPFGIYIVDDGDFDKVDGMKVKLAAPVIVKVYDD